MIKRLLAVTAVSVAVVSSAAGAALAEYPPAGSSASVSATTVPIGHTIEFAGSDFKAGSKVTVSVNDAVYATLTTGGPETAAFRSSTTMHVTNAAFVEPAAQATVTKGSSFSVRVTMNKLGMNVLTGSGVDPAGNPRLVTAKVTVTPIVATKTTTASGSSLPFTGSSVIIPGAIIGLTMMGGGFLLLTTVRSRRVGGVHS